MIVVALFVTMPVATKLILTMAGIMIVIQSSVMTIIQKLYHKTPADEALVRSGVGGMHVVVDGGCIIVPSMHQLIRVSLRTVKSLCNCEGPESLVTKDHARLDVRAEAFARVGADAQCVLNAARSFGDASSDDVKLSQVVTGKLAASMRSVAATYDSNEVPGDREKFARAVQEKAKEELAANGLIVETMTISRLERTGESQG